MKMNISASANSYSILGVLTALVLFALLTGCNAGVERPESVAHADSPPGYTFKSLPKLVATSEIVVVGTVKSAEKGERVVPGDTLYNRDVSLQVEKQFYGATVGLTIVVHQDGYEGETSFEFSDLPWVYPGDRVAFFLAHAPGDPPNHYEIIAVPGMLVIEDSGTVSTEATDPIARELDGQQWSVVAPRIRGAVQVVKKEGIKPLPPGPFGESF